MRRTIQIYSTVLTTLFLMTNCRHSNKASKHDRPNIVFIVVDDLRPVLGCYGDTLAITPHLDKISSQSVRFDRVYCQQSVCNPSRSSFLTGKRPDNLKIWDNNHSFRQMYPDMVTLPQFFKNQDYRTQAIGKIFHDPVWAKDSLSWTDSQLHTVTTFEGKYHNEENMAYLGRKGYPTEIADSPGESYIDIRVRNSALKFLDEKTDKPFFLAVGFRRPHLPFSAPREFWEMHNPGEFEYTQSHMEGIPDLAFHNYKELRGYQGMPKEAFTSSEETQLLRHGYYAATSYIDAQIGLIYEKLSEKDLLDNTILMITSDHGFHLAEHRLWCKTSNFELDTRVPLIVKLPGTDYSGTSDAIVELIDMYPTLVDAAGFGLPDGLDGQSFKPVLEDVSNKHKDFAISQFPRPPYYPADASPEQMGYSIRTKRYRYTQWVNWDTGAIDARELYDHAVDAAETQNLANDINYSNIQDSLRIVINAAIGIRAESSN